MKALVAEFLGTFLLMLTILVVVFEGWPYPAFIIGANLTVLVYLTGPISNAHLNPAITVGFWIRNRIPLRQVLTYVAAQTGGTLLAYWAISVTIGPNSHDNSYMYRSPESIIIGEAIGTFLLASVIWTVATLKRTAGNWYYGVAIGGIVAAGITLFGDMSGAYFNPATVLSCWLAGLTMTEELPLLVVVILLSSVISAILYNRLETLLDQ
jgi:aquaporin Z